MMEGSSIRSAVSVGRTRLCPFSLLAGGTGSKDGNLLGLKETCM